MKKIIYNHAGRFLVAAIFLFMTYSCTGDLDRYPTNDITSEIVYSDFEGYQSVFAKVHGAMAQTGHDGPSGKPDIQLEDGSSSDFLRSFFNIQSLTTEEAICTWSSSNMPDLNYMNWNSNTLFVVGLYYRAMYLITLSNELIREADPGKVSSRGITGKEAEEIALFRTEARFIRALQYWVLLDVFGNPPFVDENSPMGTYLPQQIKRADLFDYVESELLSIEPSLKDTKTNAYGRADKATACALLARLYLNAKVYTGKDRYDDAAKYALKIIDSGKYSLKSNYEGLFLADNNVNNPEVIFSINYDGQRTQSYGGTTFMISACFIGTRPDVPGVNFQEYYGMGGLAGWFGYRSRKELYNRFEDTDKRKLFIGSKSSVDNVAEFTDGMAVSKFRNVTSGGAYGSNFDQGFSDTDFPLFRLAEMKMIYAEATVRGAASGDMARAVREMNDIRERAFGNNSKNYDQINLSTILNERSREFYWEAQRRTDLIRFGLFTSASNVWQWKGGVKDGIGTDDKYNLFPIPAADLMANPNLVQNTGY